MGQHCGRRWLQSLQGLIPPRQDSRASYAASYSGAKLSPGPTGADLPPPRWGSEPVSKVVSKSAPCPVDTAENPCHY
jgi:hypothetical protein